MTTQPATASVTFTFEDDATDDEIVERIASVVVACDHEHRELGGGGLRVISVTEASR